MKKFYHILCCAALLSVTAVSCAKLEISENSASSELKQGFIKVDVEETKTAFDAGTSKIVWQAGDQIGLFTADGVLNNTVATLSSSGAGSSTGEFTFSYEGEITGTIYAYYPYNTSVTFSGTTFSNLVLPAKQTYETLNDAVSNCILAGKEDDKGVLHFKNTLSIVQIKLTGSSDLSQVALWGKDESLSGYGIVDISNSDDPTFEIDPANALYSGKSTGAVFATNYTGSYKTGTGTKLTTLSSEPYSLYFLVPAREYIAEDLYLDFTTPEFSMAKVAQNSHFFFRNTCQPFTTINVAKPTFSNPVNLSKDEEGNAIFSNCYAVKPSSSDAAYTFAARAADGSLRYGSAEEAKDSPGATARLVWATAEGLVSNISVDWTNKTINFTVPGLNTQGSAIIALVNQYNNSIYWLWHIWITDAGTFQWGESPTFMDRNLGAEWTPKIFSEIETLTKEKALSTSGLLFQYGNSYPFPRANTMEPAANGSSTNQEKKAFGEFTQTIVLYHFNKWCNGFFATGRKLVSEASSFEMDDLRWYPMTCNYCSESDTDKNAGAAWASDVKPYEDGAKYSWGRGSSKARRDPCPAGYKVPSDKQMTWLRRSNGVKESDNHSFYWQYDLDKNSFVCSAKTPVKKSYGVLQTTEWKRDQNDKGNGDVIWFPKQGVRRGKGFGNAGAMELNGFFGTTVTSGTLYLWCVAPDAGTTIEGTATILSSKGSATSTGEYWKVDTGNLYEAGFLCTSSACAVRCVKMTAADNLNSYLDAGTLTDGGTDPNPWE